MKQHPKGSVFALSGKDNKPAQRFKVLSTNIDYSSAWQIYANERCDDDSSQSNLLHEHTDFITMIDEMIML